MHLLWERDKLGWTLFIKGDKQIMYCKFCATEIPEGQTICPACGKEQEQPTPPSAMSSGVKIVITVLCVVALIAVLAVVVFLGMDRDDTDATTVPTTQATTGTTEGTEAAVGAPEGSVSYTVTDEQAAAQANEVIATVGETQLTNAQLQLLYRAQVFSFLNDYYYYLSAFGVDLTKGLDQQTCVVDNTKSWQEYFLESAVNSWKSYAVLCEMAKAENYQLSDKAKENIANVESDMQAEVTAGNYESLEAMVLDQGGAGATAEGMAAYQKLIFTAMDYFDTKYAGMTPTDAEIETYYNDNAKTLEEAGNGKDAGKTVDVRHILIKVTGGTTDESGTTTYSDQEWADCQAKAQQIYDQWKNGEATEDSFAKLANEKSEDGGSNTNGGLYKGVPAGQMVTEFNDWIMDGSRKPGDTGLVKTVHGYHIMYYSADEAIWYSAAKNEILSQRFQEFFSKGEEQYPMEVDYTKAVLGELKLA